MLYLFIITPLLGSIRNYCKYKIFNIYVFIRSPILYILFTLYLQTTNIWKILIFERWFFLIYKSLLSLYNNDYNTKKQKYIQKYNLKY